MRGSVRVLLIVAACLALPTAAHGATPFTAGSGTDATVAVGSDGSGHVVWETDEASVKVGYCRVSSGASACNRSEPLPFPETPGLDVQSAGRAQVFTPAANKVVIVAGCWQCPSGPQDRVYRWISTNNGDSFTGPVEIGTGQGNNGFGAWLDGAGIFVAANSSRVKAQNGATGGEGVQIASGGVFVYGPEVAQVPASSKLVAATNDLETVKYGVYDGSPLSVANINDEANWDKDLTLPSPEGDNSDTALNSGPNGVALSYLSFDPGDSHVGLRRFDAATDAFGGPVYVEGPDPIDNAGIGEPDSFQDTAGRIHVLWRSLYDGGRLRYTVSDTAGNSFSTAATLARSESFHQPELAAGADGRGFATWTPNVAGPIRVVPLDPLAESAPPPPPPPAGAPVLDTSPPAIGGFRTGDPTLFPGQRTVFRFTASEPGLAVLTFEKRFKGLKGKRKGKKVCLPRSRKRLRALRRRAANPRAFRRLLKKRSCPGFRGIGEIRQRVAPGLNTIAFNGRLAGRKLKPGRYRARLAVTDGAGLVSRTKTLRFKVVKAKKKRRGERARLRG